MTVSWGRVRLGPPNLMFTLYSARLFTLPEQVPIYMKPIFRIEVQYEILKFNSPEFTNLDYFLSPFPLFGTPQNKELSRNDGRKHIPQNPLYKTQTY